MSNSRSQIICGKDPEQRGFASFTLARTIVASGEVTRTRKTTAVFRAGSHSFFFFTADVLHEALPYLLAAEKDYECLGLLAGLQDVQYFLSIVYHNLGMINERDAVAQRHQATVEKGENLAALVHDEDVEAVLNLVEKIGVTLSSRK